MRPTTLFVVFSIGAIGALAYLGKQVGLKAPVVPDLKMPSLPALPGDESGANGSGVKVHKWQDAEGQWHYGNAPPPGVESEVLTINTDQNILASPKQKPVPETSTGTTGDDILDSPSAMPVPYQQAQKLLGMTPGPGNGGVEIPSNLPIPYQEAEKLLGMTPEERYGQSTNH